MDCSLRFIACRQENSKIKQSTHGREVNLPGSFESDRCNCAGFSTTTSGLFVCPLLLFKKLKRPSLSGCFCSPKSFPCVNKPLGTGRPGLITSSCGIRLILPGNWISTSATTNLEPVNGIQSADQLGMAVKRAVPVRAF